MASSSRTTGRGPPQSRQVFKDQTDRLCRFRGDIRACCCLEVTGAVRICSWRPRWYLDVSRDSVPDCVKTGHQLAKWEEDCCGEVAPVCPNATEIEGQPKEFLLLNNIVVALQAFFPSWSFRDPSILSGLHLICQPFLNGESADETSLRVFGAIERTAAIKKRHESHIAFVSFEQSKCLAIDIAR